MNKRNVVAMVIAFILGILCSILWRTVFISKNATPQTINDGLITYYIIYTTIVSLPISIYSSTNPWAFSWMLILGTYIAGSLFIPYFGQFGPFDMIFLFIYTIPGIMVAFIVRTVKTKIIKTNNA